MTSPIERIRYYDGEYLRAFDFQAEQAYHIEMRRRLNMGLHLFGIVEGLQLRGIGSASATGVTILPGMAIDAFGREMFVLSPYTFNDPIDLQANHITSPGLFEVWLRYKTEADTPASAGYTDCSATKELTRTHETYEVVLQPRAGSPPAVTPPAITDPISEDPDTDTSAGIFLGIIQADSSNANGTFSLPLNQPIDKMHYIGLRAQTIEPPNMGTSGAAVILSSNSARMAPAAVEVLSNLFVDQNLVVGENFALDLTTFLTPPASPPFPTPEGGVKIAADLFLQGNFYSQRGTNWLSLGEYVKSFMQDIQTRTQNLAILPVATGGGTAMLFLPNPSLVNPPQPKVSVWITGVAYNANYILTPGTQISYSVDVDVTQDAATGGWKVTPTWAVGPIDLTNHSPLDSISVACLVIFNPR